MDNLDLRNKGFMLEQCAKKMQQIQDSDYNCLDEIGLISLVAFVMQLGAAKMAFDLWRMGKLSDELTLRLVDTFIGTFQSDINNVLDFEIED